MEFGLRKVLLLIFDTRRLFSLNVEGFLRRIFFKQNFVYISMQLRKLIKTRALTKTIS